MNDFYILLSQFFSTCLLQYFYICLGKIKQIKNSNAYENIDLGSLQVWSGCFIYNSELGMRVYYLN